MKTRQSLVSNSSSSSFILVFPKRPGCVAEVQQHMFNGVDKTIKSQYSDYGRTTRDISIDVFNSLEHKNKCATQKDLYEEFLTLAHHNAYYAFENGSMNKGTLNSDIHKVMDCVKMFGDAKYLDLLRDISEIDEEYYIQHDALVIKHGTAKMKWDQYPKAFTDEEAELNKIRWDKQRPLSDKKDKIIEKKAKAMMKEFVDEHKGWWYTIISYSDNEGEYGSFMEHSDIFRHMNHIQISHH